MCMGTSPLLTGRVSKELRDTLDKVSDGSYHTQAIKVFSKFLSVSGCLCLSLSVCLSVSVSRLVVTVWCAGLWLFSIFKYFFKEFFVIAT